MEDLTEEELAFVFEMEPATKHKRINSLYNPHQYRILTVADPRTGFTKAYYLCISCSGLGCVGYSILTTTYNDKDNYKVQSGVKCFVCDGRGRIPVDNEVNNDIPCDLCMEKQQNGVYSWYSKRELRDKRLCLDCMDKACADLGQMHEAFLALSDRVERLYQMVQALPDKKDTNKS